MPRVIDEELGAILSATDALIPAVSRDMANPPWDEATARILILRLSPFADIAGSTSHLVLFSECRKALPGAYIDFGFFPDRRDRAALSSRGLPFFYALESGRDPRDFDLILVSNSFALELVNLPYLYSGSLIPMTASARASADLGDMPIIIMGGSNAACAGALVLPGPDREESGDSLVDGIFFGEGEGAIGEIAVALTRPGVTRSERLEGAAAIAGLWRALSGVPASRQIILPHPPQLLRYPVLNSAGAGTAKLQISAGCPGFCSFCLEGWESRPYRETSVAEIAACARELKVSSGASTLEVYSYNFNTHSCVFDLIFELCRIFRRVNFMSQRLDILADSPALTAAELMADKRSFTLGIEGISERMRAFYRKGIDEAQIDAAVKRLSVPAVRELKLFYIIAGIEDDADIAEFAAWATATAEERKKTAPGRRMLVSAGFLVRLPFTPLQFAPLCLDRDRLEATARRMEGACAAAGIEFRLAADFEEYYVDQLLALGGPKLSPWLVLCPKEGIVYDGGLSSGTGKSLESFALKSGVLNDAFMAEKGESWRPPLAFADDNFEILHKQYLLAAGFSPNAARLRIPQAQSAERRLRLERLMEAKRRFPSILVRITFPRDLSRAGEEYRASWVMRALLAPGGDAVLSVFDAEDALFSKGAPLEGMLDRYWGQGRYRILGPDVRRLEKSATAAGFEILPEPMSLERIDIVLESPLSHAQEAEDAVKAWLSEERIRFVEERAGAERKLKCAPRDVKKKMFLEANIRGTDQAASDKVEISLALGPKARLSACLTKLSRVEVKIAAFGASAEGSAQPRG
jgi:hypothetical protein